MPAGYKVSLQPADWETTILIGDYDSEEEADLAAVERLRNANDGDVVWLEINTAFWSATDRFRRADGSIVHERWKQVRRGRGYFEEL
jgi:hypothetical protein